MHVRKGVMLLCDVIDVDVIVDIDYEIYLVTRACSVSINVLMFKCSVVQE